MNADDWTGPGTSNDEIDVDDWEKELSKQQADITATNDILNEPDILLPPTPACQAAVEAGSGIASVDVTVSEAAGAAVSPTPSNESNIKTEGESSPDNVLEHAKSLVRYPRSHQPGAVVAGLRRLGHGNTKADTASSPVSGPACTATYSSSGGSSNQQLAATRSIVMGKGIEKQTAIAVDGEQQEVAKLTVSSHPSGGNPNPSRKDNKNVVEYFGPTTTTAAATGNATNVKNRGELKLAKLNVLTGRPQQKSSADTPGSPISNSQTNGRLTNGGCTSRRKQKLAKLAAATGREAKGRNNTTMDSGSSNNTPKVGATPATMNRGQQKLAKLHASTNGRKAPTTIPQKDLSSSFTAHPPSSTGRTGNRRDQKLAKLAAATGRQHRNSTEVADTEGAHAEVDRMVLDEESMDTEAAMIGVEEENSRIDLRGELESEAEADGEMPSCVVGRSGPRVTPSLVDPPGMRMSFHTSGTGTEEDGEIPEESMESATESVESENIRESIAPNLEVATGQAGTPAVEDGDSTGLPVSNETPRALEDPNEYLAVANLVQEDSLLNLPTGALESHDVAALEKAKYARQQKTKQHLVGLVVIGALILLAVILSVVYGSDRKDHVGDTTYAPTVSSAPSTSFGPSSAPSYSTRESYIHSILPTVTVNAMETNILSPQALAWDWLEQDLQLNNYSDWRALQRFALATFFHATGGRNHWDEQFKDGWMDHEKHECNWKWRKSLFVYGDPSNHNSTTYSNSPCDVIDTLNLDVLQDEGIIQNIWLWGINLNGTLPPEIGMLTSLRSINLDPKEGDFWYNPELEKLERVSVWLNGTIPSQLGLCKDLEVLSVQANDFAGTVPTQLGALSSLSFIRLPFSSLSGDLPTYIASMTALQVLNVSRNALSSMPSEAGSMTSLQSLDLLSNNLPSIPSEIGLWTSMLTLNIGGNDLAWIPSEIGHLTTLETLDLNYNAISFIPSELRLLTAMQSLVLSGNDLTDFPSEILFLSALKELRLSKNGLSSIPSELGHLTQLTSLDLWGNGITNFPSQIGLMTGMLTLNLWTNNLRGHIPSQLGQMSIMEELRLDSNELTGSLPTEMGMMSNMRKLLMSSNSLTGPIPNELGSMSLLTHAEMFLNDLGGSIPSELGLWTSMSRLSIERNSLSGTLPSELGFMHNIDFLDLSENLLTGQIPSEIGSMTKTTLLWLPHNRLNGTIPSELRFMKNLETLRLEYNFLTGKIPSEIGSMSTLDSINLEQNAISGTIPSELGVLPWVIYLILDLNALTGSIPSQLGNLRGWSVLLNRNSLTGPIPSDLGRAFLSRLEFSDNALTGTIPTQIGLAGDRLSIWKVNHNIFTGVIPTEMGLLTKMQKFYINTNSFSGPIPTELGLATDIKELYLNTNRLSGAVPSQLGKFTAVNIAQLQDNQFAGTIPQDLDEWVLTGSLSWLTLHDNHLSGTVSEPLCTLGLSDTYAGLGISFDCTHELCGCCWCPCLGSQVNDSNKNSSDCIAQKFVPSEDDEEWPGLFPINDDTQTFITINIKTDRQPQDVTVVWKLFGFFGTSVTLDAENLTDASTLYSYTRQLDADEVYTLQLHDASGDGMCCEHGFGWIAITSSTPSDDFVNGTVVWAATGDVLEDVMDIHIFENSEGEILTWGPF